MTRGQTAVNGDALYLLEVRVGLGQDADSMLAPALEAHARARRLMSMATAKQGMAIEVVYRIELRSEARPASWSRRSTNRRRAERGAGAHHARRVIRFA